MKTTSLYLLLRWLALLGAVQGFISTSTSSRSTASATPITNPGPTLWKSTKFPASTSLPTPPSASRTHQSSRLQAVVPAGLLPMAAIAPHVWTSLIPPILGWYKSEYTVSFGYGLATATTAWTVLRNSASSSAGGTAVSCLLPLHAYALVFYGLRLNVFLLVRNILSKRIQTFNQSIEDRALARGNRWVTRTPFVLSCGWLYYGLAIPVWCTSQLVAARSTTAAIPAWALASLQGLIGLTWVGFGLAALGDITKTWVKQSHTDEHFLVTSGIFSKIRHPNYSGEILGWTANALTGLLATLLLLWKNKPSITAIANLAMSGVGWMGIVFVLLRATNTLEARQKTEYGESSKYKEWIQSSWGGWQLSTKKQHEPKIELDDTIEEDMGSGI